MDDREERLAYRAPEVARLLGVSRSIVYDWIKAGTIPSVTVGSTVLVPRVSLEEWLARRTRVRGA